MKKTIKKIVALGLAMAMVATSVVTFQSADVKAQDEIVNYALNATVTTSTNESADYNGAKAVDGDMSTRWSSQFINNQWIKLDFGKTVKIGSVQLFWEAAYASQYKIEWSNDDKTWNEALTFNNSQYTSETSHMFYNRPVRYIKITFTKRATAYGVSLFEVRALGNAEPTTEAPTTEAPTTEAPTTKAPEQQTIMVDSSLLQISDNATATASSVEGPEFSANNVLDRDSKTRWSSAFKDGEYITIDLGEVCKVASVVIYWEAAFAAEYTIEGSIDGQNWNPIPVDGPMVGLVSYNKYYSMYEARYVKITCVRRGTPYGVSIYDITMMGTKKVPLNIGGPVTEAPTTEATTEATTVAPTEAPTTAEATTVEETTTLPGPLEVMGAVVTEPKDNTLGIVWGQDAERINSGCTYNVFIDGILRFVNVPCGYYEYDGVEAGEHTVLIQSLLNGQSSKGKTIVFNVQGQKMKTDLAVGATVTGPAMEGYDPSNLCDGKNDSVWRVRQLYPSLKIDLGKVCDISAVEIKWLSSNEAPKGVGISTSQDGENWDYHTNVDIPAMNYSSDWTFVPLVAKARYIMVSMGGYNNLAHFYSARQISVY